MITSTFNFNPHRPAFFLLAKNIPRAERISLLPKIIPQRLGDKSLRITAKILQHP
jgi:hypothetical protein